MRIAIVLLIFFVTATNTFSQVTFDKVRESEKIKHSITLTVRNDWLDYNMDNEDDPHTLDTIDYFQVKGSEFRLYANFINPLKYRISLSSKSIDDELQKATEEFLTTSVDFLSENKIIGASASGRPMIKIQDTLLSLEPELAQAYAVTIINNPEIFEDTDSALKKAMFDLDFIETKKEISDMFNERFKSLKSINTINEITSYLDSEVFFSKLKQKMDALKENARKLEKSYGDSEIKKIDGLSQMFQNNIQTIVGQIESFEKKYEELKGKYNTILKYFEIIHNEGYVDKNRFKLKTIGKLNSKKRHEIKLKIEKLEFDDDEKTLKTKKTDEFLIHIRKATNFIPVIASGVVYTTLSFAQFGTDEDSDGNTIVTQSAEEENEIAVGAYLNLYLNNNWDVPLFAQFGIGPSKEKPLLFIGGGFSLFNKITMSLGTVFTWQPELNNLSIGQQVSGTSEIQNDTSFSFDTKPNFYIGLSFDITK